MKRRDFVKNTALATSSLFIGHSVLGNLNPSLITRPTSEIYEGFQNPPVSAKLFVRWWWNGNRLDEQEILRELDVMKEAGIGGVEINPIAFPGDTDSVGYKPLTIFEDDWLNMLDVALKGAKERGMVCDMIVGSGWPFGGEFLKKEEQSQMVTIETIDLDGGKKYSYDVDDLLKKVDPQLYSKNEDVYKDLLMVRLVPKEAEEFTQGRDLFPEIQGGKLVFEIPAGAYVLYYVVKLSGYMAVINGAPGAAGPVLNHYSKPATEAYLNRISDSINGRMGDMGTYLRAMFCDSLELEGANWNGDLPDEFRKRRGYDLEQYLPFVLKKVGHMGNPVDEQYGTNFSPEVVDRLKRVEIDYYQTRIELFKERFIDTFNEWCHRNNVKSRMQAYGRGMHPLEASMEIDIPECETWLFKDVGREYPNTGLAGRGPRMCNKYVSSGAALAGKKIVSCEEITNTAMAFMATLENIKIAGDQSNISGVNHSVLHGFNYSPPEAPFPGWIRFGTFFSERNTWWPYFQRWSAYKARLSFLFQNSSQRANVGILQPLTDSWLKIGPQRDPFPVKWYPEYHNNLWEVVNHNGGGCDYISQNIINQSRFTSGQMSYGERSYSTLLLPETETLDVPTANSLLKFAEEGGKIVFIGKTPYKSASYENSEHKDGEVASIVQQLLRNYSNTVVEYPSPDEDLITWYAELQENIGIQPYAQFEKPHKYLNQAAYMTNDMPFYFIANTSLSEHISVKTTFNVDENLYPWIWNPETGEKKPYPVKNSRNELQLEIPKATSFLIVFEKEKQGEEYRILPTPERGRKVEGAWNLTLQHMEGGTQTIDLPSLIDLIEMDETKHFAGEAFYEKEITVDSDDIQFIDLGDVKGISELSLNGEYIDVQWYGAHIYDVGEKLKKGKNTLSIKLTTITGNYLKGEKNNKVAQNWTGRQEYYPMGILGPVTLI